MQCYAPAAAGAANNGVCGFQITLMEKLCLMQTGHILQTRHPLTKG